MTIFCIILKVDMVMMNIKEVELQALPRVRRCIDIGHFKFAISAYH